MSTVRGILRALLVLAVAVPAVAHADIPPPDITACRRATEGASCCGGTRTCVLSQCTYYEFAYSGTDALVPFEPVPTGRDAAYSDAETGGDASSGSTYPQKTWYPCLSCAGLSWLSNNCPEAGLPDVRPSSDGDAPSNAVDVAATGDANQPDIPVDGNRGGVDATVTRDANQPDIPVSGNPGGLDAAIAGDANKPGGGKRGGGCVVGGWISTRALAPWALAGLFSTLVTVIRRRRPKDH